MLTRKPPQLDQVPKRLATKKEVDAADHVFKQIYHIKYKLYDESNRPRINFVFSKPKLWLNEIQQSHGEIHNSYVAFSFDTPYIISFIYSSNIIQYKLI